MLQPTAPNPTRPAFDPVGRSGLLLQTPGLCV